jgi:hypothetical protein
LGTANGTNATKNFRVGDITDALVANQTLQQVLDNGSDLVDGNNFQGTGAGVDNNGENVIGLGSNAAADNTADNVNGFGSSSAAGNVGTGVNARGRNSALNNEGDFVNADGPDAANGNIGNYVNAIGRGAAKDNEGNHVNAFGVDAGLGNILNNQTIFSNTSLPSYTNAAAAATAITVLNGASADCTYLYYDASTGIVKAIRL